MDKRLAILILTLLVSVAPGTTAFGAGTARKSLLRDGFALAGVDGKLSGGGKDRWVFEFGSDVSDDKGLVKAGTKVELLRSSTLERMIADANERSDAAYRLWARITKYKDKNYIYPIYFLPLGRKVKPKPSTGKEAKKEEIKPVIDDPNDELTIPKELREKLQTRQIVGPEQLQKRLELKLDSILADRVGFIVREGEWEGQSGTPNPGTDDGLVFAPDALGRGIQRVRLRLLFCEVLERAERKQSAEPDPLRLKIAGIVTEHKGKHYLLLQRAVRVYSHGNFGR